MRPFPHQLKTIATVFSTVLVISCQFVGGSSWAEHERTVENGGLQSVLNDSPVVNPIPEMNREEACPPCELLFRKLKTVGVDGKLGKIVRVQERGEAKSGTGMMYDWATASLIHTCAYLREFFGQRSCRVELAHRADGYGPRLDRLAERMMVFNPALGSSDARCPCTTVDRVAIVLSRTDKHSLPVNSTCAYRHNHGIELAHVEDAAHPSRRSSACKFASGEQVTNYTDLWRCMQQANCGITDDWLQMVVFRDPRPAVVSAYYHLGVHSDMNLGSLEAFIPRELPIMCQWLTIRYMLFKGLLARQSVDFWYEDAMSEPLEWHYLWFDAIGLLLPSHVVEATAKAASADELDFSHKKFDKHPGEDAKTKTTGARRFEDEVSPDVLEIADAVLRVWLPPMLLQKLGVAP